MTAAVAHDVRRSADGKTLAVHVPMQFKKRGGRKVVIAPAGVPPQTNQSTNATRHIGADDGLVRTLAQAFHFQRLLDEGCYATIGDLAHAEKLDKSLVARTLRLTLLAPDIVEAILDSRQDASVQRQTLLRGMPLDWEKQRAAVDAA